MNEFKIGQYAYYRSRAEGRFVVMRLLPQAKGKPRYIIRSEDDAHWNTRPRQANCAEPPARDDPQPDALLGTAMKSKAPDTRV
jgi:hypothetical protein